LNQPSICAGCIHWRTYTNADSVSLGGAGKKHRDVSRLGYLGNR
jgi:hypothetical protein